ncbi:MAG: class I SAM-dependent methyltransferase [Colwellia sp.]|nr:class I SAM-dependent methyltransferase [Colwellia sp.]
MNKPYSQSCENNKESILSIIKEVLCLKKHLLEIGSGTGQHAVYFAPNLPQLNWQTSDLSVNHLGINQWIDEFPSNNLKRPILLDLHSASKNQLPEVIDSIFTANTLHIISWSLVKQFFNYVSATLATRGVLCIYGPFNYNNEFSSQSNANFDVWLKNRDVKSGVRDFEAIVSLANSVDLKLLNDHEMPANNRLLVFIKE